MARRHGRTPFSFHLSFTPLRSFQRDFHSYANFIFPRSIYSELVYLIGIAFLPSSKSRISGPIVTQHSIEIFWDMCASVPALQGLFLRDHFTNYTEQSTAPCPLRWPASTLTSLEIQGFSRLSFIPQWIMKSKWKDTIRAPKVFFHHLPRKTLTSDTAGTRDHLNSREAARRSRFLAGLFTSRCCPQSIAIFSTEARGL